MWHPSAQPILLEDSPPPPINLPSLPQTRPVESLTYAELEAELNLRKRRQMEDDLRQLRVGLPTQFFGIVADFGKTLQEATIKTSVADGPTIKLERKDSLIQRTLPKREIVPLDDDDDDDDGPPLRRLRVR